MANNTWERIDMLMTQYADLAAARAAKQAALDEAVLKARAGHQPVIDSLDSRLAEVEQKLRDLAEANREEFKTAPDGTGRSYESNGIVIGFRKLLDKVGLPRGDAKKQVALEYLAQYRPDFVRRTPEFDLVSLLAALKDGDGALTKALAERGITLKPGKDEFFLKKREA